MSRDQLATAGLMRGDGTGGMELRWVEMLEVSRELWPPSSFRQQAWFVLSNGLSWGRAEWGLTPSPQWGRRGQMVRLSPWIELRSEDDHEMPSRVVLVAMG